MAVVDSKCGVVGGALTRSKDLKGWVIEEYKKRVGEVSYPW